jgi:phage-related protein
VPLARRWRFYETSAGSQPVKEFITSRDVPPADRDEILAAMADVRKNGLAWARHLRGDVWEVRAIGNRVIYRILFATEGARSQVLLALTALNKKTQKTPAPEIDLAEARLADWRKRAAPKRRPHRSP